MEKLNQTHDDLIEVEGNLSLILEAVASKAEKHQPALVGASLFAAERLLKDSLNKLKHAIGVIDERMTQDVSITRQP